MIRIQAKKSELQTKRQSYRPKQKQSELQPGRPPESEPNRAEKVPEWDSGVSTESHPLKPSWIDLPRGQKLLPN